MASRLLRKIVNFFLSFFQAVKRLMTQSQKYFTTDPSRSVEFEGDVH